ncbi:MAG: putative pterin-4-alpha-carbinolamine dehydratase [bacterium]|nr:MAG: putative pterin-4-alpha-carbinolamine dehydratase [bacterium]
MENTINESQLSHKSCKPCEGGVAPMTEDEIKAKLDMIAGWKYKDGCIERRFLFKDHYETIAFVNAVAWISHAQGHHPDMLVGYNGCKIRYSTHSIGGMSENDFICAARVNSLLSP